MILKGKIMVHPKGDLIKIISYKNGVIEWETIMPDKYGKIHSGVIYGSEVNKIYDINEEIDKYLPEEDYENRKIKNRRFDNRQK